MSYRHFDIGHHRKVPLFGKNLKQYSVETVKTFDKNAYPASFRPV